nr:MAG TPA: KN motif [Caudoviricetes sp.]DAS08436.1 MAG TPA: KN motif [Caudoviricetes sp.]
MDVLSKIDSFAAKQGYHIDLTLFKALNTVGT